MKKFIGISAFFLAVLFLLIFLGREGGAQSQSGDDKTQSDMAQIIERLDKIEAQLDLILENQEKTFAELQRGRYFTKRS